MSKSIREVRRQQLVAQLVEIKAVKFGKFTLSSGLSSDYYVDIKLALLRRETLNTIVWLVRDVLDLWGAGTRGIPFDAIGGPELGVVPLVGALVAELKLPVGGFIIRKNVKKHGTESLIEGLPGRPCNVVLVEDVSTTGASLIRCAQILRDAGHRVIQAVVVVDREQGAPVIMADAHIPCVALLQASDLLDYRDKMKVP